MVTSSRTFRRSRAASSAWGPSAWCSSEAETNLTVTGAVVQPQPNYGGIWAAGSGEQVIRQRYSRDAFVAEYEAQYNRNFRLKSMAINLNNGFLEYSGAFVPGTAGQVLRLSRTQDQLLADYDEWWNKGYRLAELKSYVSNGVIYYNGIWNPNTSGQYLRLNRTQAQFLDEYNTLWGEGFRLISISTDVVNGSLRYHGVWNPSTVNQALRHGRSRAAFLADTQTLANSGFRLVVADSYTVNNDTFYDAVYNPGTAAQQYSVADNQTDFVNKHNAHVSAGRRLQSFISDQVEGVALDLFASHLQSQFNGKMVGMAATIAAGARTKVVTLGQRRTAVDTAQPASADARMNLASVSKTITAAGVLHALRAKGLSPETSIGTYLPANWTRGANVNTITFRQLFTHTSGFRDPDTLTYADLKAHVAAGVRTADQVPAYRNTNYALFRVILPYLVGFNPSGISEAGMPVALSNAFMSYMNTNVFARAGIATVSLVPSGSTRTLCYPFPAGSTRGIDYGDWTDAGGGAGYQLSSNEVAKFLVKLREGAIIPQNWITTMNNGLLGWQSLNPSDNGGYYVHGGYFPPQPGELNTLAINFKSGVQLAVQINSGVQSGLDVLGTIVTGYNNAWVPVPQ
jgi:CubicO group peptidase (beta-lactamase class C family)